MSEPKPLRLPPGEKLLLPYQARWIADKSPLKVAEKGRRTGLTWAEAADAVLEAARASGASNHFYLATGKEMAQEFIEASSGWAKAFEHAASEIQEEVLRDGEDDILVYRIYFASGRRIDALSSRPTNLRGRQGNLTIDEAAFHDGLPEVIKAAAPLQMWGGRVRVISTHNGVETDFNELVQDARAGRRKWSVHRITLEDACREGLYRRICLVRGRDWSPQAEAEWIRGLMEDAVTPEDAEEEYMCVPKRGGGAYLSWDLIESCMAAERPVLRFSGSAEFNACREPVRERSVREWCEARLHPLLAALPDRRSAWGVDFGRKANRTVVAPIQTDSDVRMEVPFLLELHNVPYRQQEQILFFLVDGLPRWTAGALDARGNGEYLAEQAGDRYGSGRVEAVQLSQGWYLSQMPRFKSAFEDRTIRIPRDREVIDDLRALQVIQGVPKLPPSTGQKGGRHGDAAVALALAHYAARSAPTVYEYHRVPRPSQMASDRRFRDGDWRRVKATAGFRLRRLI